ncbi:MAG TPA: allantoate amidohydrolase [Verrucomicrobiae bacterium]|jgi:allantoate deiminase|nr:allantoate amidohydrolase [Verrucomicrobiae bacterium]
MNAAQKIMQRLEALAEISNESGKITRTFASPAMRRANELVAQWMREAGMTTRVDAMGNLIGHYPGKTPDAKILLLGSHLDTVRDAGKFDGPLGIVLAIACVENLHRQKIKPPFAIEVVGFSDEEGVRYQTTYLGSRAITGGLDARDLKRRDADGISVGEALRNFGCNPAELKSARMNPAKLIGYVEAHIEQGPVLEQEKIAVGIVTGIAGQSRCRIDFSGQSGHAGTVPMKLRKDALCAAAEFVLAVESLAQRTQGLVATVGEICAEPGASNVIPGKARLTLDVRHASDSIRRRALDGLKHTALKIARRRKLKLDLEEVHEAAAIVCSKKLSAQLALSVKRHQKRALHLPSGAGHDAAVMAKITPVAMLFVQCKGGVSHHPDESAKVEDVRVALDVLSDFLLRLAKTHEQV